MFARKILTLSTVAFGALSIVPLAHAESANLTQPGSLLIFPNVKIKWDSSGGVIQDTILNLANGYVTGVSVQMYFVNGDPPVDPVFGGNPPRLLERGHPGCNYSDCMIRLGRYESTYWSARTGQPGGCPFAVLDPGAPPGRPDPQDPANRVLRGFIYAWAVDEFGREINWNSLTGSALIVDYENGTGWEYNAYAFQALTGARGQMLPEPGTLRLDGNEFSLPPAVLVLNFTASGPWSLPGGGPVAQVDTELTLMPVSRDLRQDNDGPITTKARFSVTNMYGVEFSGTTRCITCWDQELLSAYDPPNHLLREYLQSDTGTARIDGIASARVCGSDSEPAALIGMATRILTFNPLESGGDWNRNGMLDADDYDALLSCLDASGPNPSPLPSDCLAVFGLDGDDDVDLQDFSAFASAFGFAHQSYTPIILNGQGAEPAIIRYDVSSGPNP
jgi:hypothetical protein